MSGTILLLSGPNLNLLGEREPEIYGTTTLADLVDIATKAAAEHGYELEHLQSNHEGDLVDAIHGARNRCDALVLNAGAFTHYSFALADALATFTGVKVELHISNPEAREHWRHGIPARKSDPLPDGGRQPRGRRVSLTFRRVVQDGTDAGGQTGMDTGPDSLC